MGLVQKLVKWLLAIVLAGVFIAAGANKLTGSIHPDTHNFLVKAFVNYAKTWPLNLTGWSAETLRIAVGTFEVTFGALALCPHYTRLSAFVFMALMAGATFVHFTIREPFIVPAVIGALSVLLFLVSGDAVASNKQSSSQKKKQ